MTIQTSLDALLQALDGIAYVTDRAGAIVAYGHRRWNAFAHANDAAPWSRPERVLGTNVLEVTQGGETRAAYRAFLERLARSPDEEPIVFPFRCDAPDRRREQKMAIAGLWTQGRHRGFLFHATLLDEQTRPPLDIYDFHALTRALRENARRPHVGMCSFCQRVRFEAGGAAEWLDGPEYYRRGGGSDVVISHGVCPDCHSRWVGDHALDAGPGER